NIDPGTETPNDTIPVSTVTLIDTLAPTVPMKHDGAYYTQADIDRAKANLTTEPWASGWNKLINNSHAQTSYIAQPTVKIIRGGNRPEEPDPDNYSRAMNDAHAAFQLGVRWKISGDDSYAQAAVNILNAWANTCTRVSGDPNVALALGIYGYEFAVAGEQLRGYSGWAAADFQKYQQWMLTVFAPGNISFLNHFGCHPEHSWSNWDLCNMASLMSIGILTDKRTLYNRVINYLQKGAGNGNINRTIFYVFPAPNDYMAEMQESGRDQGHCTLSLALLTTICKLAENQGDDIWGFNENLILKASEYVAKYNVAMLDVPYKVYSWHEGDPWTGCGVKTTELPVIGSSGRGGGRPQWEMVYNYYVKIKGKTATYTEMGANKSRPEGGGGDYGPNSGGFDQLGFGTLLFSRK
ncbi:MAG: alginate lyase family protein, partial [Bacteroidota bacterium]|nr:alginate lyase family protein [Bacteroidota bacterium]